MLVELCVIEAMGIWFSLESLNIVYVCGRGWGRSSRFEVRIRPISILLATRLLGNELNARVLWGPQPHQV